MRTDRRPGVAVEGPVPELADELYELHRRYAELTK